VLTHVEKDSEFAADLAQLLMGDARPQPRPTKKLPDLNLVDALKDRGEEELVQQLGKLAASELQHLAQHYEAAPAKQVKAMSRDDLITCLVAKAHQLLGRGARVYQADICVRH
jgi:Ran GTPase-activating protein (RanGAP) involved in mRNA processing and transport